jgi:hypothetical protein
LSVALFLNDNPFVRTQRRGNPEAWTSGLLRLGPRRFLFEGESIVFRQFLQRVHQTLTRGRRKARFPKAARTAPRLTARLRVENLEARELLTAYPLAFNVNQALSYLNESGNVSGAYSQDIQEQEPGSLSTHYSGTLNALYDPSAKTFQFLAAGSSLTAANSGSWEPLAGGTYGYAPANYGNYAGYDDIFTFEMGVFSFRGLTGNLAHANPVSVAGGILPSNENVHVAGNDDYSFQGTNYTEYGTSSLSTTPTNNPFLPGQFQDLGGGSFHVIVPIDVSFSQSWAPTYSPTSISPALSRRTPATARPRSPVAY